MCLGKPEKSEGFFTPGHPALFFVQTETQAHQPSLVRDIYGAVREILSIGPPKAFQAVAMNRQAIGEIDRECVGIDKIHGVQSHQKIVGRAFGPEGSTSPVPKVCVARFGQGVKRLRPTAGGGEGGGTKVTDPVLACQLVLELLVVQNPQGFYPVFPDGLERVENR